jgi:hypothetical protein
VATAGRVGAPVGPMSAGGAGGCSRRPRGSRRGWWWRQDRPVVHGRGPLWRMASAGSR